jgi:predicted nucleotidyltransferase
MICQTGSMDEARAAEVMAESAAVLRQAGARFAYLHGSRAFGPYRPDSDVDIAAYFGGQPPNAFDILMPPGVDLLVLDHAPLELAGRVAARGRLLFDDDPVSRVRWRLPPGRFTSTSSRASPARTGSSRPVSPAGAGSPW